MVFSMSLLGKIPFFNYEDNIFMKIYKINGHKHDDILFSWFIVCCGCVGAINLAKLAPSMSRLIDYLNISLSTSGLLGGLFSILMISTGLIGGIIIAKYGPRLAMLAGLQISFWGCVIPILNQNITSLMLGRALEGYGFLLINLSAPVLLSLHTNSKIRGKVMGIWGSFMPAGNAIIILVAPIVYLLSDWHFLWLLSGFYTFCILFLAYQIIPFDPQYFKTKNKEKLVPLVIQSIKNWKIIIIGATFACHSLIFLGNMQFLPYYFEKIQGYSQNLAYLATASYCLISFAGHLYCGILLNNGKKPKNLIGFAFIISAIFVSLFFGVFDKLIFFEEIRIIKFFAIIIVAFFMGLTPPTIFFLMSYIEPASRLTPINYGYMVQIQAIGIFAGSFLFGWLVDMTGDWTTLGYLSILISLFGILGGYLSSRAIAVSIK